MTTVTLRTRLPAPADLVWAGVNTPRVLAEVSKPLIDFRPIDPPVWPDTWPDGEALAAMRLFGVLPIGRQVIGISRPPPEGEKRFLRDDGRGGAMSGIRRWDHLITVEPDGDGTAYEDRVTVEAGLRTPLVAAFARRFYRHRQARWRALAADSARLRAMIAGQ